MAVKGMNAQRFDFAMEQFDLAITINPNEADAYEGLAITHLNMGNSEAGIEMYQKAIELNPKKAQSFFNLGGALMNVERFEEALEMFKRGHEIDPEEINILQQMAIAQYRLGDKESAAESAEKALAIAGDDPKILNIAATIYLQSENYEKSAEVLEKVIEIQPDNVEAMYNLGVAKKQQGDKELGRIEANPNDADQLRLLADKLFAEADGAFTKVVEANPNDVDAWYQLGLLADKRDSFDRAIEAFTKVTELQASNARAWAGLSRVYARKSEVSEGEVAAECVKKANEAFQVYDCVQKASGEAEIAACIEQNWNKDPIYLSPDNPNPYLSADTICNEYESNEVAADEKYKGKIIRISGTIQNIGKDIVNKKPYIIIGGSGVLDGVKCFFSEPSPVARLSKGQLVNVEGTVLGKTEANSLFFVEFENCILQ